MKTASGSEKEVVRITPQSIFFKGTEYETTKVSLTFYKRKNKHKGGTLILFTAIIYISILIVILTSQVYSIFFDYMFFIYFPWGVSFLYLVFLIYWNYIIEYVIVEFEGSKGKLFKVNNRRNFDLIKSLKEKVSSVTYVELNKGFLI